MQRAFEYALHLVESRRHEQAERELGELHRQCLAWLEATPQPPYRHRAEEARVCMLRASNLQAMGRHDLAEALFASAHRAADELAASKPEDLRWQFQRAIVRSNRAVNLRSLGRHRPAETLFREASGLLDRLVEDHPASPMLRLEQAQLRMNHANNLHAIGRTVEAESLLAQTQAALDDWRRADLGDTALGRHCAAVCINRANLLQATGRRQEAERVYREALRAIVPRGAADAAGVAPIRGSLLANRAVNLHQLGLHRRAERLFGLAERLRSALLEPDPASAARRADLAELRLGRAANLAALGRDAHAMPLYEQAGAELDAQCKAQPANEALRLQLVRLALHRFGSLCRLGLRPAAERALDEAREHLLLLRGAVDADVGRFAILLACHLMRASAQGWAAPRATAGRLVELCAATMDRLDLLDAPFDPGNVADPVVGQGAHDASSLIELTLSWLLAHAREGCDALVPGLLADWHGRYACAQRLLAAEASPAAAATPEPAAAATQDVPTAATPQRRACARIRQLRIEQRVLRARLEYLRTLPLAAGDAVPGTPMEDLRARLESCRDELLALQREFGATDRPALSWEEVRAAVTPGRALVALLQVRDLDPGRPERPAPRRAVALVLRAGAQSFDLLELPGPTLACALACDNARSAAELPDGEDLRAAVCGAWALIAPCLGGVGEVFVALHGVLGLLPWQAAGDEPGGAWTVSAHHGMGLAVRALQAGALAGIAPPGPARALGALAHSPPGRAGDDGGPPDAERGLRAGERDAIPATYVDRAIALASWPHAHALDGRAGLLSDPPPLLQLSCHGNEHEAHTGPGDSCTLAAEIDAVLRERGRKVDAVVLIACCTARASTNPWGESGGWAVALHDSSRVVLGSLHPVADLYGPLFCALLHRQWRRTNDLRSALADVRQRLRSGQWADGEDDMQSLRALWLGGIERHWPARNPAEREAKAMALAQADVALSELAGQDYGRGTNQAGDRRLRLLAESMVLFG